MTQQVVKLTGPPPSDRFSRIDGFISFEETDSMTVRLEVTKLSQSTSDGTNIKSKRIRRLFKFDGDPLTFGASALLALSGRKVDVPFFTGGVEYFQKNIPAETKGGVYSDRETDVKPKNDTTRFTQTAWVPDTNHLAEIQTFQTQRTEMMITRFYKKIETSLKDAKKIIHSDNLDKEILLEKLESLIEDLDKVKNHRESALFELVILGNTQKEKSEDRTIFRINEVEVANLIAVCQQIALNLYSGTKPIYIKGAKILREKGRYTLGTGTATKLLNDDQLACLKAALLEFIQEGLFKRHTIRDGIELHAVPTITKGGEVMASGIANLYMDGRMTPLNYTDAAKLVLFIQ